MWISLSSHILQKQKAASPLGWENLRVLHSTLWCQPNGSVWPTKLWRVLCIFLFLTLGIFFSFSVYFDSKKKIYKNKKPSFMIAKFFFQTKKRNQLLKNMMNGILCFIFNAAHEGTAIGMRPDSPGRRGPWAERRPSDFVGRGQVGVSGFLLNSRKHLLACSHTHPSSLSVILCVFSTCYWLGCRLFLRKHHWYNVGLSAFKLWFSQLPQLLTYLTVGSCMVEGNSQLLMCKQNPMIVSIIPPLLLSCHQVVCESQGAESSVLCLQVSLRAVPFGSPSATHPRAGIKGKGWVGRTTLHSQGSKGNVSDAFKASTCFLRN